MNNLIIFILIVVLGLVPFGIGVVYTLYRRTIVLPVALVVFFASMFCAIVAFAVSEFGFKSLYWAIPLSLFALVASNAVFKKMIQKPIKKLTKNINSIALGVLNFEVDKNTIDKKNELGELARSLDITLKGLHNTADFAKTIAKGKFDFNYELLSADDEIGNALINMRKSLIIATEQEQKRKEEEEKNKFITTGVARFSDIMRLHSDNIDKLSNVLLSNLVDYIDAVQGALFVINDENQDDISYDMSGAVAYSRPKNMKVSFKIGEGLVGRCAFERKTIYMTEVPNNYVTITSGLGTANPTCILLVPAIIDETVYGIIELASFNKLDDYKIKLIEKLSDNIAAAFASTRNHERTVKLLNDSQKYAEEVAAQEEELRQNIEELQATQEEMRRKEDLFREMQIKFDRQEQILREQNEHVDSNVELN